MHAICVSTDMEMTPRLDKTVVSMPMKRFALRLAWKSAVSAPLSETLAMNYQMLRKGAESNLMSARRT